MLLTSDAVKVIGFGAWDENDPKFGEFIRVKAETDEDTRRYTFVKDSERPEVDSLVNLKLHSRMKATAFNDAQGKAQSGTKEQLRVTGFTLAKAA